MDIDFPGKMHFGLILEKVNRLSYSKLRTIVIHFKGSFVNWKNYEQFCLTKGWTLSNDGFAWFNQFTVKKKVK